LLRVRAKGLWTVAPRVAELRDHDLRDPGPEEALVVTRASGISRGTERLVFEGRVPESQWPVMRAPLQHGGFPFPVSYGYAAVGTVQAGPDALRGRRVFCLHPHHDAFASRRPHVRAGARRRCRTTAPCSPPTWRRR
jgi:NADPH:quinone reductase-like Zn-dependent oxidoreductase